MKRRDALRAGAGLAALVSLTGCSSGSVWSDTSDESESTHAPSGTEARTADRVTTAPRASGTPTQGSVGPPDHAPRFREFVESREITVRDLQVAGPIVTLRYVTPSTDYQAVSQDIGRVAGGFYREVRDGWHATRLEATVTDARGTPLATWYARTEWFRQFQREEISGDELSLKVLRTVERTDTTGTETASVSGSLKR